MSGASGGARVAVIVPTLATPARAAGLRRAVDSVLGQRGMQASALVVVNGDGFDRRLVGELAGRRGIRIVERAQAHLPLALAAGRAHVDTEWFSELDDDDALLPDALAARFSAAAGGAIDAVVSNGYVVENGRRRLHVPDWRAVERDPLRAMQTASWLRPGAGLFRTAAITEDYFSGMPCYLEWTYLMLRLIDAGGLRFLDAPTFVYNADTPDSVSKSRACVEGQPRAFAQLLELELPAELQRILRRRRTAACNAVANLHLQEGRLASAWRWHLRTLCNEGGWRYALNARRLIHASVVPSRP